MPRAFIPFSETIDPNNQPDLRKAVKETLERAVAEKLTEMDTSGIFESSEPIHIYFEVEQMEPIPEA